MSPWTHCLSVQKRLAGPRYYISTNCETLNKGNFLKYPVTGAMEGAEVQPVHQALTSILREMIPGA